jgi:NAD(P)H-dependent flavin oxidoreductase YrpB (nitropropane dioxygenase family)
VANGSVLSTRFTDLVGCRVPLQQAGMGGVSTPELAAAVAGAGGLGMVALPGAPAPYVAAVLERLATMTDGAYGVNFLMPFLDEGALDEAAARCRVVEFFYGAPSAALAERARSNGALVCWQVGSVDEARAAVGAGCDLIVVQGTEAGGHVRGHTPMLPLLDAVLARVDVPVVAAGGIATARGVAAALAAGADAVRIGTRFVACVECDAHADYVRALLDADDDATMLTETFAAGWPDAPHRVLRSCVDAAARLDRDVVGESGSGPGSHPIVRFSAEPPGREATGTIGAMALYAGQGVGAVSSVARAADVVRELTDGAAELLRRFA